MSDFSELLMQEMEHTVFILKPDADGQPIYAAISEFARKRTGKPDAEVIGKTAMDIYGGRLGEIAFRHHQRAIQSGETQVYEIMLPLDGVSRPVKTTLKPILDADGSVRCVIGSSVDITGGQIIREMQTELETFNADVEDFISLAAHDLRSPMKQVSQVAQLLRRDFQDLGDGKLELINLLERIGDKAMKLVSDVLAHAQATTTSADNMEFEFSQVVSDLSEVLDPQQKITITHDSGSVVGDRVATQVILRNLMDNSIKHAGANVANMHLAISLEDMGDGFVQIQVADSGVGFSEAALKILNGGKLEVDSGFGLLGVRRLIRARGGILSAGNRDDGQGAVVSFTLPGHVADRRSRRMRVA